MAEEEVGGRVWAAKINAGGSFSFYFEILHRMMETGLP